jgi:hypothetical protein
MLMLERLCAFTPDIGRRNHRQKAFRNTTADIIASNHSFRFLLMSNWITVQLDECLSIERITEGGSSQVENEATLRDERMISQNVCRSSASSYPARDTATTHLLVFPPLNLVSSHRRSFQYCILLCSLLAWIDHAAPA